VRIFVGRIKVKRLGFVGRIRVVRVSGSPKAEDKEGDRVIETAALLSSGYEAPTPQLLVPIDLARALGL